MHASASQDLPRLGERYWVDPAGNRIIRPRARVPLQIGGDGRKRVMGITSPRLSDADPLRLQSASRRHTMQENGRVKMAH